MKAALVHASGLLLAALTLPVPTVQAQAPKRGGELRLAIQAEPRTFDPAQATDEPSELVRYLTGGVLVRLNRATQKLEPELAESWTLSKDGKVLTLRLRPGVRFSNGATLQARDVCATFTRLMDPALDAPGAEVFRTIQGGMRCETRDTQTVALRFGEPVPGVLRLLDDIAIQAAASDPAHGPWLGPFLVSQHRAGSFITLARNPHYWKRDSQGGQLPYLDSIRLEIQRNRDFELMRFRNGELHLVNNLDPVLFERLQTASPSLVRDVGIALDTEQVWFNQAPAAPLPPHKKAWFASTAFRRAISLAINRQDIARVVFKGHATPALGPVSPANRAWIHAGLAAPAYDPKAALASLARSGFQLRGNTLIDNTGNPVEFSIITNAGNRTREQMGAMIQDDLKKIGMRVSVAPLDFPSLIGRIAKTYDYDACLLGLVMTDLDPIAQSQVWLSSGPQHQWNPGQSTPQTPWEAEIDRSMRLLAVEASPAARKRAFDRVQEIVVEQAPFIYLVNRHALVAVSQEVRGVQPVVLRPQTLWNVERLWLASGAQVSQR